jgi:hypothetical protein
VFRDIFGLFRDISGWLQLQVRLFRLQQVSLPLQQLRLVELLHLGHPALTELLLLHSERDIATQDGLDGRGGLIPHL